MKLVFKNLIRRPARTGALLLLSMFLSFAVFGGTMTVLSLKRGLESLEARLGADVIAVPDKAKNKLEDILLQGVPGYFYMDKENVEKIAATEGVEAVSPQYFLASVSAGCCSVPVQIIGFEPETDFSVQPWIKQSYGKELQNDEVLAGANINAEVGEHLRFYDQSVKVAAKLDKTGTELDNAVYTNAQTLQSLLGAAVDKGLVVLAKNDPDKLVSSVLIKVKDGYSAEDVASDISINIRHVSAVNTKNMVSGIAQSLSGISDMTGLMIIAVWVLSLIVMAIAFSMMINERKREFAVLRVIGATRNRLAATVLGEAFFIGLVGGVLGVLLGALAVFPFSGLIEAKLGLPYLTPSVGAAASAALAAVLSAVIAGPLTSAASAVRVSKMDTGLILREGN